MSHAGETEIMSGNVKDIVNRLSRDMTNRVPFTVHEPKKDARFAAASPQLYLGTYQYTAQQPDELSFAIGDVIEFLEEIEDGWSRGRLKTTGQIGMFPTNFVSPKVANSTTMTTTTPLTPKSTKTNDVTIRTSEPRANERTPSIIGDVVAPTATTAALVGANVAHASNTEAADSHKTKEMARIKFVYTPQHVDELALNEVDALVTVLRKDCGDPGWFEGEVGGKRGLFPDNFVELVQVPVNTSSGASYASCMNSSRLATSGGGGGSPSERKPPLNNPPPPAVPAKPLKPKAELGASSIASTTTTMTSSSTSSSSAAAAASKATPSSASNTAAPLNKSAFAAIREQVQKGLKVVGPDQISTVQTRTSVDRDGDGRPSSTGSTSEPTGVDWSSADQISQLEHVTKSRARPPGKRPASMLMTRKKSSDSLLDDVTPASTHASSMMPAATSNNSVSTSMYVNSPSSIPSSLSSVASSNLASAQTTPFKLATTSSTTSTMKNAIRPTASNGSSISDQDANIGKHVVELSAKNSNELDAPGSTSNSETVSRAEYNALLARMAALESRLASLERSNRF